MLIDTLGISQVQITREAKFKEDLGADLLDMVELVMEFENKFKVSVPDEVAEEIKTVAEVEDYLLDLLDKKEIRL